MCEEESVQYLRDLCKEKETLDGATSQDNILTAKTPKPRDTLRCRTAVGRQGERTGYWMCTTKTEYGESARILVPVKEHPRFIRWQAAGVPVGTA